MGGNKERAVLMHIRLCSLEYTIKWIMHTVSQLLLSSLCSIWSSSCDLDYGFISAHLPALFTYNGAVFHNGVIKNMWSYICSDQSWHAGNFPCRTAALVICPKRPFINYVRIILTIFDPPPSKIFQTPPPYSYVRFHFVFQHNKMLLEKNQLHKNSQFDVNQNK